MHIKKPSGTGSACIIFLLYCHMHSAIYMATFKNAYKKNKWHWKCMHYISPVLPHALQYIWLHLRMHIKKTSGTGSACIIFLLYCHTHSSIYVATFKKAYINKPSGTGSACIIFLLYCHTHSAIYVATFKNAYINKPSGTGSACIQMKLCCCCMPNRRFCIVQSVHTALSFSESPERLMNSSAGVFGQICSSEGGVSDKKCMERNLPVSEDCSKESSDITL